MSHDADVLILGGGCAGISLAVALARNAPALRVHILEQRQSYSRDRTWCFWNAEPHAFEAGVTHRWHSWRVRHGSTEALQQSRRYTYDHLPSDAFYRLGQEEMARAAQEQSLGVTVLAVSESTDGYSVETNRGILRARYLFDSRPERALLEQAVLVQRFRGWHVHTEKPCFQPETVELMDFQPTVDGGRTPFLYVLPFSATEALVEATYFERPHLPAADAEADLRRYLDTRQSGHFEVLYREGASLPMGSRHSQTAQQSPGFPIGMRGGRVKPSSGYAFLRIQRQSRLLAAALAAGAGLPRRFDPPIYGLLDRIFLKALRRYPHRVPDYFVSMFQSLPADALVRFLSETASPWEILRVMLALPKSDFIRAGLLCWNEAQT